MSDNPYDDLIDAKLGSMAGVDTQAEAVNPYDALIEEKTQAQQEELWSGARLATQTDPDKYARLRNVAKALEVDPSIFGHTVDTSIGAGALDHAESVDAANRMGLDRFQFRTPTVAAWLSNIENMRLAHDDVSSGHFQKMVDATRSGLDQMVQAKHINDAMSAGLDPDSDPRIADMGKRMEASQRATESESLVPRLVEKNLTTAGPMAGTLLFGAGVGAVAGAAAVAVEAGPLAPVAFGVGMALGSGYATAQLEQAGAYLQYVHAMKAKGLPVDLRGAKRAAQVVGMINGAIEVGGFGLALKFMPGLKIIFQEGAPKILLQQNIRKLVAKAVLGYALELGSESIQEGVQQVSTNIGEKVVTGEPIDIKTLAGDFADTTLQSVEAFALIGAGGAGLSLHQQLSSRAAGERNAKNLSEYSRMAVASRLAKRAPDKMGEFADLAVEDGHPSTLYLGTDEFTTLFQDKKIDPSEAAKELGIGQEYVDALKQGTDIAIPFRTYLSKIANSQYHPALAGDLKGLSGGGMEEMSAKEMAVFDTKLESLKKMLDEAKAESDGETASGLRSEPSYRYTKQQLIDAHHSESDADWMAIVHAAFVKTMGIRNAVDVMAEYPVVTTGEDPTGSTLNQRVFQGSPARALEGGTWSEEYIGSGEDTMGQGAGHYFTSSETAAEWYRTTLSGGEDGWTTRMTSSFYEAYKKSPASYHAGGFAAARYWTQVYGSDAAEKMRAEATSLDTAIPDLAGVYKRAKVAELVDLREGIKLAESGSFERVFNRPGNVFEAEIPEDSELANWDLSVADKKQGTGIFAKLLRSGLIDKVVNAQVELEGADLADTKKYEDVRSEVDEMPFSDFYARLSETIRVEMAQSRGPDSIASSAMMIKRGNLLASGLLRDAGIPGHTYTSGHGNQNFVMYDTSRMTLVSTFYQAALRSGEQLNRTVHEIRANIGEDRLVVGDHAEGQPMPSVVGGKILDRNLDQTETSWTADKIEGIPQRLFDEAVAETGRGREVVDSLSERMGPKSPAFWSRALSLPDRSRFWYEISAAYFRRVFSDMDNVELSRFIDVVAATSPQANPYFNIARAVGVMSEHLQHIPVASDVISATSVGRALSGVGLEGAKVRSFSGTMQYILGLSDERPMSTNDRQVASTFGVGPDAIGSNPVLYEVLSRFYIKLRDELNSKLPPGAEPYQTWQIQALGWVQERMESEKRGGTLKTETSDDFQQALGRLLGKMGRAGVRVENGTISVDALSDPLVPDITSNTRRDYLDSPIATIEVQTLLTESGPKIAESLARARASGDENSVREFEAITQRALNSLGQRTSTGQSLAERIASEIAGKKVVIGRVVIGQGTYEGSVGTNVRLPVGRLTDQQIDAFLSVIGEAWQQGAMAASSFREVEDPSVGPWPGWTRTYQVFLEGRTEITNQEIAAFSEALGGHELNINSSISNGITVDINPLFGEGGPIGPNEEEVIAAADKVFGEFSYNLIDKNHKSTYIERADYPAKVKSHGEARRSEVIQSIVGKSGLDSELIGKYLDTSAPAASQKLLDRAASKGQRAGARRSGDVSPGEKARAEKLKAEYRLKFSGLKSLQAETAKILTDYESELASKWKPRADARYAANQKARSAIQAINLETDQQYAASPSPTPPVSDRWTADRGAIPGEPMMTLDEKPDGSWSAAIIEVADPQTAEINGVQALMPDGTPLGPMRKSAEEAARDAEAFIDGEDAILNQPSRPRNEREWAAANRGFNRGRSEAIMADLFTRHDVPQYGFGPVFIGKPRQMARIDPESGERVKISEFIQAVHFSTQAGLEVTGVDPMKAGSGAAGGERRRFGLRDYGQFGGLGARVYFYVRTGEALPIKEKTVEGQYAYQVQLGNMYDMRVDPLGIVKKEGTANLDKLEQAISDAGFDGRITAAGPGQDSDVAVVFDQPKGSTIPVEVFDANTVNPAGGGRWREGFPGRVADDPTFYQNQPARGGISFMADGRPYHITLNATKDMSTFLHELGHMFIDVTGRIAQKEGASEQTKLDYQASIEWMGYKDHQERVDAIAEIIALVKESKRLESVGLALSDEQQTRYDFLKEREEKWARGFEAFLMEGKPPSPELARPFARFARWLTALYRKNSNLRVALSDDIRKVMQRMIATDEEILKVEQHDQYIPMFDNAKEAGMTETQFKRYQEIAAEAHLEAYRQVDLKIKAEQERETKAWWRQEREALVVPVTEQIDSKPSVRAAQFLRDGSIPDDIADDNRLLTQDGSPVKLSGAALDTMYGPVSRPIKRKLGPGSFVKAGGVHPDFIAPAFGFTSGDAMVRAITEQPARSKQIAAEVDRQMIAAHGDIFRDGTIETVSRDAIHESTGHLKMLQLELDAMNRSAGLPVVKLSKAVLQGYAEQQIDASTVRQVDPNRFLQSERKAATEATKAARSGKFPEAIEWQKKRMINRYLYSAAIEAKKQADSGIKFLSKQNGDKERGKLGKMDTIDPVTKQVIHSYLQQQDKLLERYELRKVSGTAVAARQSLAAWMDSEMKAGRTPVVPQHLLDESQRMNYADMKLGDFLDLVDTVKNIKKQADRKQRLRVGAQEVMFDAAVEQGVAQIKENGFDTDPTRLAKENQSWTRRKIIDPLRAIDAELVRLREIANQLDGDDPNGFFHRILIHPLDDAATRDHEKNIAITKIILEAIQLLPAKDRALLASRESLVIPSIGRTVLFSNLITVGLNSGNESNLFKLLTGWQTERQDNAPWTEKTLAEMHGMLNEDHWDLIQRIWDALETLWPELEALERRETGLPPVRVEPKPFVINLPDGTTKTYRGGYFPVIYESLFSGRNLEAPVGVGGSLYAPNQAKAVTPHGHTVTRLENYSAPISLSLENVVSHITSVIHDTTHREALGEAWRYMTDTRVRDAMVQHMGEAYYRMVLDRLRAVAQSRNLPSAFNHWLHRMQGAVSASMMGYKLSVTLQNFANFVLAKQSVGALPMAKATLQFARDWRGMTELVTSLSGVMRHRMDSRDQYIRLAYDQKLSLDSSRRKVIQGEVIRMGYRMMSYTNAVSEFPSWLAEFQNSQAKGLTEEESIRSADDMVISTFGSGDTKDLAAVQDNEVMRNLTMFYGFFSAVYNMTRRAGRTAAKQWRGGEKGRAVSGALEYVLWNIVVMNALSEILSGRPPDDDPEDDLKDRVKNVAEWAAARAASYTFAMVPFVRDVYRSAESGFTGGMRRNVQLTPITAVGDEAAKTMIAIGKAGLEIMESDDKLDPEMLAQLGGNIGSGAIKSWAIYEGMPVSQFNITAGFLWDWMVNENSPENWSEGTHDLLFTKKKK